MIIKTLKEAEAKQNAGGKLIEIKGTGENRVYVFADEKKEVKEAKKNEK